MVNLEYLYNPDAAKGVFSKNYFSDKKLGFSIIENGTILPYKRKIDGKTTPNSWGYGGIVDKEGTFIKSSHVNSKAGSFYTPPPESIKYSSETVVYLGMFHSTWGHVITDNIRRVWFLKSEYFNEFKNCPLVYLLCTKREKFSLESYKNFRRLLEILELDVNNLQLIEQPTQFEKVILPDESFNGCRNFTNEYLDMIDCVKNFALKNRTPSTIKKIYYLHGARQTGEERLAEYFKSKGYEVVRPEKLTLDEQLNILINCESLASTIGSTSHNSVFMHDRQEIILIPRGEEAFKNSYQAALNQINSINANYVDSTLTIFGNRYNNIFYIISSQLKRFFDDEWNGYEEDDLKAFLKYVKDSTSKNLVINPLAKNYYAPIFEDFMEQLKNREDLIAAADMPLHWEQFRSSLTYQTHVHKRGWRDGWKIENQPSNPLDQSLDIQAIKINFPSRKVYYSVYFNETEGWSEEVSNGEMAGTTGKSKPIYGVRVRLDEAGAKEFDILYRVHKFDGEWTHWAKNGEELLSNGIKLNAIQIKLESKT